MRIRKIGVVGAGTMGSGIAALAASAGVPVVLLDVPGDDRAPSPAERGLQRALTARPAAFMDPARAALVRTGDTERDLELLADCDLVIEAIIEQLEPKQALYARLEETLGERALVASNTSGIPIGTLAAGRSESFRRRFMGMHFFNPPRYLHLVEVIPTADSSPEAVSTVTRFAERVLGKGVVVARDVPGFVANRIGVYGMARTVRLMERFDLDVQVVDALTGTFLGRPKSATFRTADITGLDVLAHVTSGLQRATGEEIGLPEWVLGMVQSGQLGEKSGSGFYRKQGKVIETVDWRSGEYAVREAELSPELAALQRRPLAERLRGALTAGGPQGEFLRALLLSTYHYALMSAPVVAHDLEGVDHALEWGFGWEMGPFRQMDAIGLDTVRQAMEAEGMAVPPLLASAGESFFRDTGDVPQALSVAGSYEPFTPAGGRTTAERLRHSGRTLLDGDDAVLLDMGEGVALLEFRSKMNTIGRGVLTQLARSLEYVNDRGLAGLVIGNDDPRTFSAGADLGMLGALVRGGDWKQVEGAVSAFQEATTSLRRAPFPVVVAPAGLSLGGGAEMALHADLVQAHAELYMGLVEVGVGLLPAGGGSKELLFRFTSELEAYEEADVFEGIKRAFQAIALARTSTSALDAFRVGFLRQGDRISMNRDLLLADARSQVLALAPGYVAPVPRTITALGREGLGNLRYALWAFQEAGQASAHDARIGEAVAYVLCGGDGPRRTVTEQDILELEREKFLELLGTRETQERIAHMLETGKPLRN